MKKLLLTAATLCSVSGLALAQTSAPAPNPAASSANPSTPGSTTAPNAGAAAAAPTGLRVANTATVALKFVSVKPADMMSSKLVGMKIYNNQNEGLGEVEDLVIDNGKTITGVVAGVGGFLGMGESYVVLDPATIVLNQKDGTWRAYVDTNKDNLKNAPKFNYSKKKS